jgi:ABC-2 type transport system ATP-binding protein
VADARGATCGQAGEEPPRHPAAGDAVILAEGLHKRFGAVPALRGLDLRVGRGTVCGVLGPNGAGKTTAVRILATLIKPDAGQARVAGYDVVRDPAQVRRRIGLVGQHSTVDRKLSGRDNLRMFGRLYHLSDRAARRRADELLESFALAEAGSRLVETYSGGMRRRLDLIATLITAPPVLFFDEPTAGLDPASRAKIWAGIRELAAGGTSVLLTTQHLEEADQLAGQIAVVDHGRVIAVGTPDELKATIGARLDVVVHDPSSLPAAAVVLGRIAGLGPQGAEAEPEQRRVSVAITGGTLVLTEVVRELDRAGLIVDDVALRRPTLDEVFLRLTGGLAGRGGAGTAAMAATVRT